MNIINILAYFLGGGLGSSTPLSVTAGHQRRGSPTRPGARERARARARPAAARIDSAARRRRRRRRRRAASRESRPSVRRPEDAIGRRVPPPTPWPSEAGRAGRALKRSDAQTPTSTEWARARRGGWRAADGGGV